MDDFAAFTPTLTPTAERPLTGLTLLIVEDSRYASEALRLMSQRSGARLRRADCLRSARRHLRVYRPTVAIIDLGLPDGSGLELIRDLAQASPRVPILLGMSGDPAMEGQARRAGADGFLAKPFESLAAFQSIILQHLPPERRPAGPRALPEEQLRPDPIAYHDDMAQVAELLGGGESPQRIRYITRFLKGVASEAGDNALLEATRDLARCEANGKPMRPALARLAGLVQTRLKQDVAI